MLPKNKKIHVTIKRLAIKPNTSPAFVDRYTAEIMNLADKWCNIDCHAIARLYGVTLGWPNRCLVFEDMHLGPLDAFLYRKNIEGGRSVQNPKITFQLLVGAARALSIAVQYLVSPIVI